MGSKSQPSLSSGQYCQSSSNFNYKFHSKPDVAVQILQFPTTERTASEENRSTKAKTRGLDFTNSSTNSNFAGMTYTIPKNKHRSKCDILTNTSRSSTNLTKITKSIESSSVLEKTKLSKEKSEKSSLSSTSDKCLRPKESLVAGVTNKYIGNCAPNLEKLSKMSKERQKFFLTQDPRKIHCLVNPDYLMRSHGQASKEEEVSAFRKKVKFSQNICNLQTDSKDPKQDFLCETIDMENPMELDFQGLDYQRTYQQDEQDLQNQRNYIRIQRHLERKRVQVETQVEVEEAVVKKLHSIPTKFDIRDRTIIEVPPDPPKPLKYARLFRSAVKPMNREIIKYEKDRRHTRYKELYTNQKARLELEDDARKEKEQVELENMGNILIEKQFNNIIDNVNKSIRTKFLKDSELQSGNKSEEKMYPYETEKSKDKFLGGSKEAKPKKGSASVISSRETIHQNICQVGKKGSKFKLKGFQKIFENKIADIDEEYEQKESKSTLPIEIGCMTRKQWLQEILSKKQKVKPDVEVGIQKIRSPDDPKFILFPSFIAESSKAEQGDASKSPIILSEIKKFKSKPLGRHYDRDLRKNIKYIKPEPKYKVKKFNLIHYRFGDPGKRLAKQISMEPQETAGLIKPTKLKTTYDYIEEKEAADKLKRQKIKEKRLLLLGLPYVIASNQLRLKSKGEQDAPTSYASSSSSDEWLPKQESPYDEELEEQRALDINARLKEFVPLNMRTKMPAPRYREPTLRMHPRRPRDYENQRIPSDTFDDIVQLKQLPYMYKMPSDTVLSPNFRKTPKRHYTKLFNTRHHHDHWDPTQTKNVDVHYHPKLVGQSYQLPKIKSNKLDKKSEEYFDTANPPCNQFVEMELTMPQWNIDEIISDFNRNKNPVVFDRNVEIIQTLCKTQDCTDASTAKKEPRSDYPGHKEYLKFLNEIKLVYSDYKQAYSDTAIERESINELEEEIRSVETCLSSLSSSQCSNLTNDSGSFLLLEDKEKIPLDYIRKSLVPFEEIQRSRFCASPIDAQKEEENPFQVLPFSGQQRAQLALTKPSDGFFTFTTRLKNGLRLRLEVPVEDVRKKAMGSRVHNKHKGLVTTDIDPNYIEELQNRPPVKACKFKSGQNIIKEALRLKFESMLIQGQIVRQQIYDNINEEHWRDMHRVKLLFEKLFTQWEVLEYNASMAIVYKIKAYYSESDHLKNIFQELEKELVRLNMDIVFTEGHWISCIMLQNFHYLLAEDEWRMKHDWIHRIKPQEAEKVETAETSQDGDKDEEIFHEDDVELENFAESIAKRSVVNIRQREKDDAWAIKEFYDNVYLRNKHPNLLPFQNADDFMRGIENLKSKTFILLLEMHFTMAINTELRSQLETFEEWCTQDLKEKREYVNRKCSKLYFMENRYNWLQKRTENFLQEPIDQSFGDELSNSYKAMIAEAWRRIVPSNVRGSGSEQDFHAMDMVSMISDVVIDLLAKFESIDTETLDLFDKKLRKRRAYLSKQSRAAYLTGKRIEMEMKKVRKNLEPPYVKPPKSRDVRQQRYYLKRKTRHVTIPKVHISERAKFFMQAFQDDYETDGVHAKPLDVHESLTQINAIQEQIIPFNFDHFLKLNSYTPNYNFKTQIELRDGPELERLQYKSVIPELQVRMAQWETIKRKIAEEQIAQNPQMYIDVV